MAVVSDGLVTAEYTVDFKKTHSQTLLPMIDEVTRMLELDLHEVDAIAVSGGPGSYTGPVSYTHLDVYKRQIVAIYKANILTIHQSIPVNGVATLTLSVEVKDNTGNISKMVEEIEEQDGIHYVKIVSRE